MKSNSVSKPQNTSSKNYNGMDSNMQRPEIRDNLDHREGEEQNNKGGDVTHNEKQTKEKHLKQKK